MLVCETGRLIPLPLLLGPLGRGSGPSEHQWDTGTDGGGLVGPMADTRGGGQLDVRTFQSPDIWAIGHVRLRQCLSHNVLKRWLEVFF